MSITLSDADRRLLAQLQKNARLSVSELARRLAVSRTTVQQRIDRLERTGAIAGYTVRLGEALQRHRLQAYVSLTAEPNANDQLVREMSRIDEVETLYTVSGKIDFIAIVTVDSPSELDTALERIGRISGVRSTETAIVLSRRLDRR